MIPCKMMDYRPPKDGWLISSGSSGANEQSFNDYAIVAYAANAGDPLLCIRRTRMDNIKLTRRRIPLMLGADQPTKPTEELQHATDQPVIPDSAWASVGKWK